MVSGISNGGGDDGNKGKISVLFVCLGNICRSPLAEAIFKQMVAKNGLSDKFDLIDSCGTGAYHAGDGYDDRSIAICRQYGVPIEGVSRKLRPDDFTTFDWIFGMDANNVRNLQAQKPRSSRANVYLFGAFDDNRPIQDPYYGGDHGFQAAYKQCLRYSQAFLTHLGFETTAKAP